MPTAQIKLSDDESQALEVLGKIKGKTPEELLREAVKNLLEQHGREKRLAALRQARGIWKDRKDLPTLAELRGEWERT